MTRPVPTRLPASRNTKDASARKEKRTCHIWEWRPEWNPSASRRSSGRQSRRLSGRPSETPSGKQFRGQSGRSSLSHLDRGPKLGKQLGKQSGRSSLNHLDRGPKLARINVSESEYFHFIDELRKEDGVHYERQPQADREHRPVPPVKRVAQIDVAERRVRVEGLQGVGASFGAHEDAGRRVGRMRGEGLRGTRLAPFWAPARRGKR